MRPSVTFAYAGAGGHSCTNQLLIGLIEEDGVVGLGVSAAALDV